MKKKQPTALTVAGSDSGGGAGLQIDLKVFSSLGVFGASAVTALTAQNSIGVRRVFRIPTKLVAEQLEAVLDDLSLGAIKTGMLWTASNVKAVVNSLSVLKKQPPLVIDPVIWAGDGTRLLSERALRTLIRELLPLSSVVTPNIDEAAYICGHEITCTEEMRQAAEKLVQLGAKGALVKGGHLKGNPTDIFFDGRAFIEMKARKKVAGVTHGTGCALSAAITAYLAKGCTESQSVKHAHQYLQGLVRNAKKLGKGSRLLIPGVGSKI